MLELRLSCAFLQPSGTDYMLGSPKDDRTLPSAWLVACCTAMISCLYFRVGGLLDTANKPIFLCTSENDEKNF